MRKRRKFTELRKKYCIRQVFRKKNHVQNLTVIGEEKKVGEKWQKLCRPRLSLTTNTSVGTVVHCVYYGNQSALYRCPA